MRAAVSDPSGRIVAVIRDDAIDELQVEGMARADTGEALQRASLGWLLVRRGSPRE